MLIDSHALLWWLEGSDLLSERAHRALEEMGSGGRQCFVSAVSFWEIRWKELRGQIEPLRSAREWPGMLSRIENLKIVPVGADIWLKTAELDWKHRDPADRIIAATALSRDVPVLTKDKRFHEGDSPVKAVW